MLLFIVVVSVLLKQHTDRLEAHPSHYHEETSSTFKPELNEQLKVECKGLNLTESAPGLKL